MADPRGFLNVRTRELPPKRPVAVRLGDYRELGLEQSTEVFTAQAGRCMDCGVPFCHRGCPLGNRIPEWNDAMWRDDLPRAIDHLHATNNFPEFTGRVCPAPCEDSCVLGINQPAVTIKNIEVTIVDRAFKEGLIQPYQPSMSTGTTVAVVGSGPAGLAAAQQLTRAGHTVVVYERDEVLGGLLTLGIPDFKLDKQLVERRIVQMREEGTQFRTGVEVGRDISWQDLEDRFDAVLVATGAQVPRDLPLPGREAAGIEYAMDYLTQANRHQAGGAAPEIDAAGKDVIIIGGGDTGSDCLGTALRQGAKSVTTLAIGKELPHERPENQPWPMTPKLFDVSTSHEEGGERKFLASTVEFLSEDGQLTGVKVAKTQYTDSGRVPTPGTEEILPADLVLISMGFTGPVTETLADYGLDLAGRVLSRSEDYSSSKPGVFVAGDAGRGQSLIVWAIAEGRAAAAAIDAYLTGSTNLPAPVKPTDQGIGEDLVSR